MTRHILIAGACRSGKTTLSLKLAKEGYMHYKMDSIKRGICKSFNIDGHDWLNLSHKMANIINTIILENYSDTVFLEEQYVLDVSHLLPKDTFIIDRNKTLILFLGYSKNSLEEQVKLIREHDQDYYWSSKLSDQQLVEMIKKNIEFSKYLESECLKYDIPYFDTSLDRENKINEIKQYILNNSNN